MGNEWHNTPLQEVCVLITDGSHFSPKDSYPGLPMGSVKDLTRFGINYSSCRTISPEDFQRLVKQGCEPEFEDVLIAKDGNSSLDTVCVHRGYEPIVLLSSVAILRPDRTKIHPDYLRYFLDNPAEREALKENFRSGSAIPRVVLKDFRKVPIYIPNLRTQTSIVRVLKSLDDKIELLRSMNETLEAMARAFFKSWFIDFDPVRKKAEGQPTGLPPEIDALFPDSFEDSELGEIPKGWEVSPFSSQIELIGGGTPKTSINQYWQGDIPWYSVVDSPRPQDIFVIDTEKHITQEAINNSSTRLLPSGTTIISARGTVGNLALTATPMCMNQSCYGVRSIIPNGDAYTYFALNNIVQSLKGMAHGSVFDTITRSTFDSATACIPSPSLIQAYGTMANPILSQVRYNLYEIQSLTTGRDSLLPRLISGELELSDSMIKKILEPTK